MGKYHKWVGHAELVLENYHRNRRELARLQGDIIHGRRESGPRPTAQPGDRTGAAAVRLSAPRLETLRREAHAVERALAALPEERKALLSMVYIDRRRSLEGAAAYLGVSYSTARRWKKQACLVLAYELGWI